MNHLSSVLREMTGCESVQLGDVIQELWSGYGVIQRATLRGSAANPPDSVEVSALSRSVVVKHIDWSAARSNRRGWGGGVSHERKVRSYAVEEHFYQTYSPSCDLRCRVPELVVAKELVEQGGWILVLEDLDAAGFKARIQSPRDHDIEACLQWLAHFHATFMHTKADGLWPIGTYWHLETRPDEFAAMPPGPLKEKAHVINLQLNQARFQTLVHGDAKIANFCFGIPSDTPESASKVAAVDFQYVGRGCGMKDVAYFLSSCLESDAKESEHQRWLDTYFKALRLALAEKCPSVNFAEIEHEWRRLYAFAWADFCRFLVGWSPGHWKLNRIADQITQSALEQLS
ncbi:MAG: oxidoreductase family protein [Planctomycetota bacterium]